MSRNSTRGVAVSVRKIVGTVALAMGLGAGTAFAADGDGGNWGYRNYDRYPQADGYFYQYPAPAPRYRTYRHYAPYGYRYREPYYAYVPPPVVYDPYYAYVPPPVVYDPYPSPRVGLYYNW